MDLWPIIKGTGLILIFFLAPGLALTLAIFPGINQIKWAERIGLGLVLGLTPQVILYFLTKNFSVPVTTETSQAAILGVTLVGAAIWAYRKDKEVEK